jgi:hypothetical protein
VKVPEFKPKYHKVTITIIIIMFVTASHVPSTVLNTLSELFSLILIRFYEANCANKLFLENRETRHNFQSLDSTVLY